MSLLTQVRSSIRFSNYVSPRSHIGDYVYCYEFAHQGVLTIYRQHMFDNQREAEIILQESDVWDVNYTITDDNELLVIIDSADEPYPLLTFLAPDGRHVNCFTLYKSFANEIINAIFYDVNRRCLWLLVSGYGDMYDRGTLIYRIQLPNEKEPSIHLENVQLIFEDKFASVPSLIHDRENDSLEVNLSNQPENLSILTIQLSDGSTRIKPSMSDILLAHLADGSEWYEVENAVSNQNQYPLLELKFKSPCNERLYTIIQTTDDELDTHLRHSGMTYDRKTNCIYLAVEIGPTQHYLYILGPLYSASFSPGCALPTDLDTLFRNVLLCRTVEEHSLHMLPIEVMFLIFSIVYAMHDGWLKDRIMLPVQD